MFTQTLRNNSHIFFLHFLPHLCGAFNLSKFSETYFHIWRFPMICLEKQNGWADAEVLLCPLDCKLRSLTLCAPQLSTDGTPKNGITGRNIKGFKVNPPFAFTTLFVGEKSLPKVSRAKKHRSNFFFTAQLKRQKEDSLSRLCLGILERTKVKSAQKLTPINSELKCQRLRLRIYTVRIF